MYIYIYIVSFSSFIFAALVKLLAFPSPADNLDIGCICISLLVTFCAGHLALAPNLSPSLRRVSRG